MKPRTIMTLVFWMICGILLIVFYRANQAQMTAFIQFFGLEMTIVQLWFISLSSVFVCFFYFGIKRMGDRKKIRLFQEDKRAFKELGQSLLSVQNLMALGEFGKARVALNSLPLEASYKAYLQAQCLQGQGNLSEALKSLKEAWDLGSDLAGFELVEALLKTGKEDQATKILDFMLEKNPEAVRPRKLRIDLAERKSQWERALELLEPFADQDPAFYQENNLPCFTNILCPTSSCPNWAAKIWMICKNCKRTIRNLFQHFYFNQKCILSRATNVARCAPWKRVLKRPVTPSF